MCLLCRAANVSENIALELFRLIVVAHDRPAARFIKNFPWVEFANGDGRVIREIEEREFREVRGVEPFSIEQIRGKHFQEYVMSHDDGVAHALVREEVEAFLRTLFQVGEVLFVRETVVVGMIREVHLIDDAHDLGRIAVLADNLFRIAPLDEKGRVYDRYLQIGINNLRGFLRALIRARDDALNVKTLQITTQRLCLLAATLREGAFRPLADVLCVQHGLAMADEVESPRAHEDEHKRDYQ